MDGGDAITPHFFFIKIGNFRYIRKPVGILDFPIGGKPQKEKKTNSQENLTKTSDGHENTQMLFRIMALFTTLPYRKRPGSIVTDPAEFSLAERFHGQGVAHIGTALFFLKQGIMAIATTHARRLVILMAEHHRGETFGILENDVSTITIRLNRPDGPAPHQAGRNEYHQTENPCFEFHKFLFQGDVPFKINFIISCSRIELKPVLFLQSGPVRSANIFG
jgi:hypothetical protein